jgi:hypothetical protein
MPGSAASGEELLEVSERSSCDRPPDRITTAAAVATSGQRQLKG